LILLLLSTWSLTIVEGESEDTYYSLRSEITYINPEDSGRIWNLTQDDYTISLFMNNSWQSVQLKTATHTLRTTQTDEDGNSIGVLELPTSRLLPGENVSFTVEYHIDAKPRVLPYISENESQSLSMIPDSLVQLYTGSEGPWLTNNVALMNLSHEIAGTETNVLRIVKKTISWIKDNIDYVTHETPRYANETYSSRVGDCDDQAILLITLLRILRIPSFLQIGAIYIPQLVGENQSLWNDHVTVVQSKIGWHGWAEVYVPPWGWLPVDLTYVLQGFKDPLNAVLYGAVVEHNAVQYMNISRFDYVADSLEAKDFILRNGFRIYSEDEMSETSANIGNSGSNTAVFDLVPIVVPIVAIVLLVLLLAVLYVHRQRRKAQTAETHLIR